MLHKSFEEMGIPTGYGSKQLLFSPAANALVIQTQSAHKNWRPERLYFRHTDWDKYRPIGQPGDLHSQEYPFVHPSKPLVAYNTMEHRFFIDAGGEEFHGGDWDSLNIFNLEVGEQIDSVSRQNLRLPSDIVRGWIVRLVAFCDSGLYVTAGLSKDGSRIDYFVAELDLAKHVLEPIALLPATFM